MYQPFSLSSPDEPIAHFDGFDGFVTGFLSRLDDGFEGFMTGSGSDR